MAFTSSFSSQQGVNNGVIVFVVFTLLCTVSLIVEASPTSNNVQQDGGSKERVKHGGAAGEEAFISLGKLLAGGGVTIGGQHNRPAGHHTTIWDLLVEKAEGYMHSMLYCTLSRPDLRDGVSGIKPCEQSPLSIAIVENLVTLLDVPNASDEKRDQALNRMIQGCNSLEQIGSQTCELENFKRVQDCFNKQQVLEQYFKLAGLESLCGISGNQTDIGAIFKTFWKNGGKDCMNPKNFDRLSQDSLLCFELIKTHPEWDLKEMTSCIADQVKKCGSTGARDAVMPLLEGILRAYLDIQKS